MKDVPKPTRVAKLETDKRGYPIPFVVLRDKNGDPHFTINDTQKTEEAQAKRLCHVCGKLLGKTFAFIGGPGSAFHQYGGYIDGPLHRECAEYAAAVCPYIAITRFKHRIEGRTLTADKAPEGTIGLIDTTVDPERPDCFVIGVTEGYTLEDSGNGVTQIYRPERPWVSTQIWVEGKRLRSLEDIQLIMSNYILNNVDQSPYTPPEYIANRSL